MTKKENKGPVAQWQSVAFAVRRLWVQIPTGPFICPIKMKPNRLFLFDIDFTLVSFRDLYTASYGHAYRKNGVEFRQDILEKSYGFANGYDQHDWVLTKLGYDEKDRKTIVPKIFDDFKREWKKQIKTVSSFEKHVCKGVIDLLEYLKTNNIAVGYVTGHIENMGKILLEKSKLMPYFITGAYSTDKGDRITVVRNAINNFKKLGYSFEKQNIYVVGDSIHDVEAAKKLSLKAIGVATGFYSVEELEKAGADITVKSLDLLVRRI